MDGWVSFHRKIEEWEWYTDPNTFRLFFHLVLKANHADGKWRGNEVKRGQHITSIDKLSDALDLSPKQIRTAMDKLKRTGEVAIKGTNKYTLVTIVNYSFYQKNDVSDGEQDGEQKASKGQTKGKQRATNNNENNENNENNKNKKSSRFTPPTVDQVTEYCKERSNNIDAESFIDFYTSKGWMVGKNKMKDWKAAVRQWERRDTKQASPKKTKFHNFDQHDYDYNDIEAKMREKRKNG